MGEGPLTAGIEIEPVEPTHPDARFCLGSYFAELDRRFEGGFEEGASNLPDPAVLRPPKGLLLVARRHGEPVGCGALRFHGAQTADIKRMWVAETARGLGLGARLLAALEDHAQAAGVEIVRLETNRALTEAIALYRSRGYEEVAPFNDERYGDHWFQKRL
jgi:ribosomal protein S18 acetylase RimI-like enzyme